jgi:hypothetical protein
MRARAVTLLAALVAAALLAPAVALGQGEAFGPLPTAPQPAPEPVVTPETPDPDGGSLGTTESLLLLAAALGLIGLIAFAIMRDARGAAPADAPARPAGGAGGGLDDPDRERAKGSRAPARRRAEQSRQRAKIARQSRKRNRPA